MPWKVGAFVFIRPPENETAVEITREEALALDPEYGRQEEALAALERSGRSLGPVDDTPLVPLEAPPPATKVEETDDGPQMLLFDVPTVAEEEWKGMPSFVQEDLAPYKSIMVHFESEEDMAAFSKLVGQRVSYSTKMIWFPEAEIGRFADKRWVDAASKAKVITAAAKEDRTRRPST